MGFAFMNRVCCSRTANRDVRADFKVLQECARNRVIRGKRIGCDLALIQVEGQQVLQQRYPYLGKLQSRSVNRMT
eukprot:5428839-Amphidinium_carterae.1